MNGKLLLLIVLCSAALSGCWARDVGAEKPYSTAVGKSFVLQKDLYIFKFQSEESILIGEPQINNRNMPNEVSNKYIGQSYYYAPGKIIILGTASRGGVIKITKAIENPPDMGGVSYVIKVEKNRIGYNFDINADGIQNYAHNPPVTPTWSDPPIFKAEYALPVPSDGIWWK